MKKTITCRPCKEQNNWEIENQYGVVLETHYATKDACVAAGQKLANQSDCSLKVCDSYSNCKE